MTRYREREVDGVTYVEQSPRHTGTPPTDYEYAARRLAYCSEFVDVKLQTLRMMRLPDSLGPPE